MISIQHSLSELDKIHRAKDGLLGCYLSAIRNSAQYAIEMDPEATIAHRKYLLALADEAATAELSGLLESRSTFRNLLRDFRDKGLHYLNGLREELAGTARALGEILESLSQADGDHEASLRATVGRLREIADSPGAGTVGPAIRAAAASIEQSVDQLRKQHQITIGQFQMEIRMLHKRIDALESAASVDELTRFLTRGEMESRLKTMGAGDYSLLIVTARGLRRTEMQFGQAIAEELAAAFAKRLRNSLPPNALVSRWGPEEMVAMVKMTKSEAVASGRWITEHLSGNYACMQGGKTVRPSLQLNVGVVETVAGEEPDKVLERVGMFLGM